MFKLFLLGPLRKYRAQLHTADLLIIDDLFIRKLPVHAGDELADVLMGRYEKRSTIVTSNRPLEDWAKLLGNVVVVTPLLDRLMHHGHLLRFDGKSWRLKESSRPPCQTRTDRLKSTCLAASGVGEFDPATSGGL